MGANELKYFLSDYYRFNYHVSEYFHPSWSDREDFSVFLKETKGFPLSGYYLSRYVLEKFRLGVVPFEVFKEATHKLAFLETARVMDYVRKFGLIAFSQIIRRSIDGKLKRLFWNLVGESEYNFITKRAAFYNPGLVEKFVDLDIRYSACGDTINRELVLVGIRCLDKLFVQSSQDFKLRLFFKMPKEEVERVMSESRPVINEQELDALKKLSLKLIKEVDPLWSRIIK